MRPEFSHSNACTVTWKWIYIFHMPLFIFISGYFSRKKKKAELPASIWKLLEPLIVFQALTLLPRFIVKGFSFSAILTPWYVLWYLLSLIYWRLLIQIIPDRILNNTKLILIVTFCVSILAGFLPSVDFFQYRERYHSCHSSFLDITWEERISICQTDTNHLVYYFLFRWLLCRYSFLSS